MPSLSCIFFSFSSFISSPTLFKSHHCFRFFFPHPFFAFCFLRLPCSPSLCLSISSLMCCSLFSHYFLILCLVSLSFSTFSSLRLLFSLIVFFFPPLILFFSRRLLLPLLSPQSCAFFISFSSLFLFLFFPLSLSLFLFPFCIFVFFSQFCSHCFLPSFSALLANLCLVSLSILFCLILISISSSQIRFSSVLFFVCFSPSLLLPLLLPFLASLILS